MRILVIGKSGQLARCLADIGSTDSQIEVLTLGRDDCDVTDVVSVLSRIEEWQASALINASAYTAVDAAETDEAEAYRVNAIGAGVAARAAALKEIPIVHISTDYVFDGSMPRPYLETDIPSPTSAYGRSKLAGEYAVLHHARRSAVLRTSWVFSQYGANFVKTMLRLAGDKDAIEVVSDQTGNPTCADDLAVACIAAARRLRSEAPLSTRLFNFAGPEAMSWHGFAVKIMRIAGEFGLKTARIDETTSAAFNRPATRPANSRLDSGVVVTEFGVQHRSIDEGLRFVMSRLR